MGLGNLTNESDNVELMDYVYALLPIFFQLSRHIFSPIDKFVIVRRQDPRSLIIVMRFGASAKAAVAAVPFVLIDSKPN